MKQNRNDRPPLSEAQLEIMNVVWGAGRTTVAEVWQRLSARRKIARNTVQTMMKRLEEKGWLKHTEDGNTFVYSAAVPRGKTLRSMVLSLVDSAFEGSAEGLIHALIQGRTISDDEARRIRKMIDEAKGGRS